MCHFEYASYTLPDILSLTSDMNDTQFHFSKHIRHVLRRCVFVLNFCQIEKEKIPPNLNARAGKWIFDLFDDTIVTSFFVKGNVLLVMV